MLLVLPMCHLCYNTDGNTSDENTSNINHVKIKIGGGHDGRRFSRDPIQALFAGGSCEQFQRRQGCPCFDVVHPAFPLPSTASPTFQGTLKDGFGEAVVASPTPIS